MNSQAQFSRWEAVLQTSDLEISLCPRLLGPFLCFFALDASSCGKCFYCDRGLTSRCEKCLLFGSVELDGGQAEIVVVPEADGTLFHVAAGLRPELSILMADIFPTG